MGKYIPINVLRYLYQKDKFIPFGLLLLINAATKTISHITPPPN